MIPGGRHPDIEALACLAEGRCPSGEREELLAHLSGCEVCLEVYDGTLRTLAAGVPAGELAARSKDSLGHSPTPPPAGGPPGRPPAGRGWPLMPIAAVAAVGILGAGLYVAFSILGPGSPGSGGIPALVEAAGGRRLIEPRLAGGFRYAPLSDPRRGSAVPPLSPPGSARRSPDRPSRRAEELDVGEEHWDLISAARRIRDEAGGGIESLEEARSLAAARLLTGDAAGAVEALLSGLERFGESAAALSDLSAAYLVQAGTGESDEAGPVLRVRALDAARHAVELDPGLAEGWFNLALAMQKQLEAAGGGAEAAGPVVEAWEKYLEVDPGSPWAGEARRRIQDLTTFSSSSSRPAPDAGELLEMALAGEQGALRETVGDGPGRLRRVLESASLCRWSEACLAGDAAVASRELKGAEVLARTYLSATGDPFYVRAVEGLGVMEATAQESAFGLCSSLKSFCQGSRREGGLGLDEAAGRIRGSLPALQRTGSPLLWSAELSLAIDEHYAGRSRESERRLTRLLEAPGIEEFPTMEGLVRWMRGTVRANRFDLAASLGDHTRALELFSRCHAMGYVASEHRLLAEVYGLLGRPAEGWRHRESAMALAHLADLDRRAALHLEAVYASLDLQLPWAALVLAGRVPDEDERIFQGTRLQLPLVRAEALEMAGRAGAAREELARASSRLAREEPHEMLARYRAEMAESRGRVLMRADPAAALEPLGRALEFFAGEGDGDPLLAARAPSILLARGRILSELGRREEAARDLERGIDLLEKAGRRLAGTPHSISLADRAWELYDAMIKLQAVDLNDPDAALAYAERARAARTLPGEGAAREGGTPDAGRIASLVPGGSAMIYYVSLESHLLAWVVRDGEIRFHREEAPRGELRRRAGEMVAALARRRFGAFRRAAGDLYGMLIRPLEPGLAGAAELHLVPDGSLAGVPFAALWDPAEGRYLVEKLPLSLVPSAAALEGHRGSAGAGGGVLVVGNPRVAAEWAAELAPLPGAEREARAVAALYRDATLLTGEQATARAFLEGAAGSRIIHFAGHALANHRRPELSALVLAPEERADPAGLLLAREIARAPLSRASLIVLGGCRTAAGRPSRTAGPLSLARPFLAAGASQVIGTLWDLDDGVAGQALVRLHESLQAGGSAAAALQRTQKDLISDDDPALRSPATWGAFTLVGREPS